MTFLITGCAGFIGSHLTLKLLSSGDTVIGIDDLSTGKDHNLQSIISHKNFTFIKGQVQTNQELEKMVQSVDGIYHLAATVGVENIINHPLRSIQNNLESTEKILKLAHQYSKKIIITSSSEVYGLNKSQIYSESDNLVLGSTQKARWLYATNKIIDEHLALAYFKQEHLPVVIVRLFNTIGPGQVSTYGMVVPRFIEQALQGKPITVYGDGKQKRCFTSVHDVVWALRQAMRLPQAVGNIMNIGGNKPVSINQLADTIVRLTKSTSKKTYIPLESMPADFQDMPHRKPDITQAKKLIGFKPNTNLAQILTEIISTY